MRFMIRRPATLLAALAALLLATPAGAFVAGSNANPPITQTINVQIIDVCGTGATNNLCAPTSTVKAYQTFANAIFAQAGTGFTFNSTIEKIHLAGDPNCNNGAVSTFCSDLNSTNGFDKFDNIHTLVNTPGNGQSDVANTLNVYLANHLFVVNDTGAIQNTNVYGWGLIGGNGIVVQTGVNSSGLSAAPDVLAHELGHNLSLTHTDQPPINNPDPSLLMNTATRAITTQTCAIQPYTCAGAPKTGFDQLTPTEITTVRNSPIRNELPNVINQVPGNPFLTDSLGCNTLNTFCVATGFYSAPGQTPLIGLSYRFLDGRFVAEPGLVWLCLGGPPNGENCTQLSGNPKPAGQTIGSHVQWTYTFTNPILPTGQYFFVSSFTYPESNCNPAGGIGATCFAPPFSTEFDFANGAVTTAGFDMTPLNGQPSGYYTSQGQLFAFNPNAPGVEHCTPQQVETNTCSILPTSPIKLPDGTFLQPDTVSCPQNDPTCSQYGVPPEILKQIIPPLSFPAPEPPTWSLFPLAIASIMILRRRRLSRPNRSVQSRSDSASS